MRTLIKKNIVEYTALHIRCVCSSVLEQRVGVKASYFLTLKSSTALYSARWSIGEQRPACQKCNGTSNLDEVSSLLCLIVIFVDVFDRR